MIIIVIIAISSLLLNLYVHTESVQDSPLYVPSLPNIRTMKLLTIYSTLHISLHNIFIEKEKYHKLQLHWPVSNLY